LYELQLPDRLHGGSLTNVHDPAQPRRGHLAAHAASCHRLPTHEPVSRVAQRTRTAAIAGVGKRATGVLPWVKLRAARPQGRGSWLCCRWCSSGHRRGQGL